MLAIHKLNKSSIYWVRIKFRSISNESTKDFDLTIEIPKCWARAVSLSLAFPLFWERIKCVLKIKCQMNSNKQSSRVRVCVCVYVWLWITRLVTSSDKKEFRDSSVTVFNHIIAYFLIFWIIRSIKWQSYLRARARAFVCVCAVRKIACIQYIHSLILFKSEFVFCCNVEKQQQSFHIASKPTKNKYRHNQYMLITCVYFCRLVILRIFFFFFFDRYMYFLFLRSCASQCTSKTSL